MYFYMGMMFDSKENIPDFGSIKMYFVGTKQLGYIEQNNKKFRKYVLLSSDLSKLNLITNAINGSTAFLTDTGETYKLSDNGWQKWSDTANSASLSLKPVEELPQTGQSGYIYLVPNEHDENDNYDEYIWTSDQTFEKIGNTAIIYPVMTGATSSHAGTAGLVPAPATRDYEYFLRGDGTWVDPDEQYDLSQKSSIDFDNLEMTNRKTGYWFCHRTPDIATFKNAPPNIQSSGTFVVRTQFFDGTNQRIQTCYYVSKGQMYQRTWVYNGSETTWSPWKKIAMFATSSSYMIDSVPIFNVTGDLVSSGYNLGTSVPSDAVFTDTTYEPATQSTDGLMSSTDKTKLDNIATPVNLLTKSDIVICTQQEYDTMQSHQGLLYFIKEVNS